MEWKIMPELNGSSGPFLPELLIGAHLKLNIEPFAPF